jgi:hypothetical protein
MVRQAWDLDEFPPGEKGRTGNGHCFHFDFKHGGFCKCPKYNPKAYGADNARTSPEGNNGSAAPSP